MEKIDKRDIPIKNMKEDLFHISTYAKSLCKYIENCSTPMTISIQGEWGSGKTSLMNIIESELCNKVDSADYFDSIWINTWELFLEDDNETAIVKLINIIMVHLEQSFSELKKETKADKFLPKLEAFSSGVLTALGV